LNLGTPMSKTILILEDETIIAMSLEGVVAEMGHTALHARSVQEALALIQTSTIDLAIIDVALRAGQSSEVVAAALRERRIPFIVCSGSTVGQLAEIFGSAPFIAKPYRDHDMEAAIRTSLPN
jgi:DNA-binding NtrC family response regulator